MFDFGTISKNKTEARESPLLWIQGVDDYIQHHVEGSGVIEAISIYLYENGNDVSATKLTGSLEVTNRVIKTKTLTSLVGGNSYVVYLHFTDNGMDTAHEIHLHVPKMGIRPSQYPAAMDVFRINESPIRIYPFQDFSATLNVAGMGVIESPTMYVYKGLTDDSANVLSDVLTVDGRQIHLKTISNLKGGSEYMMYVYFTDNGRQTVRYGEIICQKAG